MNKKYSFLAVAAVALACFAPKAEASWFSFGLDVSSQCAPSVGYCPPAYVSGYACSRPVCPPPAPHHHHCRREAPHRLPAPIPAPHHHSSGRYFK